MRPPRPFICATSIAAFVLALGTVRHSARAADIFWGGSADNSWSTLTNWTTDPSLSSATPAAVPGVEDVAIFNLTGGVPLNQITTLGESRAVGGLVFGANSTASLTIGTVDDFTLTVGAAGLATNAGAAAHTINSAVTLGATQTWTSSSANALTLAGTFTTGANSLNITGSGTGGFRLAGPVAITGSTTWTNTGAASFDATGNVTLGNNLRLAGTSGFAFSAGTLLVSGGNRSITVESVGPVSFGNIDTNDGTSRALTFNVASGSSANVDGVISESGAVIKAGAGTLTFNGANTFSSALSGLTIQDGKVDVKVANATNNPRLNMGGVAGGTPVLNLDAVYRVQDIIYSATGNPNGAVVQGSGSFSLNSTRIVDVGDSSNAVHDLTINVPITNGDTTSRGLTKRGAGTLVLGGVNSFSSTFQLEGGTTIINAGNANTGGSTVFHNTSGSTATTLTISDGVQYRLPGNIQVNSSVANGAVIDGGGTIGIHGGDRAFIVFDTEAADDLVISAGIGQSTADATNRGMRKEQAGRLVVQGVNTYLGQTDIARGTMVLDYSVNNGDNKLSNSANTQLRGSTLVLNGNASAATTESIGSGVLRLPSGTSTVSLVSNNNQMLTFDINDISRGIGEGLVDFRSNDTSRAVFQTTEANTSLGFLGAYATFNGDRWAANNGSGQLAAFTGGVIKNDRSQWHAGEHVIVDGELSGNLNVSRLGTLIFDSATSNTLTLDHPSRALTLDGGGILITEDVGANDTTITGGQILVPGVAGASRALIITNRSAGVLTIDARLGANHAPLSTTQEITLGGTGEIVLSGKNFHDGDTNIFTRVRLSGGNAIGDFSGVVLATGGDAELNLDGSNEGIGNLGGGASPNISSATVNLGAGGTLTINQTGNTTYGGAITGDGKVIKQGPGILTSNGTALGFTGEIQILGGHLDLLGDHGGLVEVSSILVRGGQIRSLQDYSGSRDKFADNATVRLEGTIGSGLRVTSNQNASRTENANVLELASGASTITVDNNASGTVTSAVTVLNFSNTTDAFVRSNNATMLVRGDALGASSGARRTGIRFASGMADGLVGSGATATSRGILPFAAGSATDSGVGDSFVTFDTTFGLRPLDVATEYATNYATAAAGENLSLTASGTGLTTKTFNSLRMDNSGGNVTLTGAGGGANTLALTSGALLVSAGASDNDAVISGFDKILAGTSDAGDDELVVRITSSHAAAANAVLTINSPIANQPNGGGVTHLTKTGDGTLILGGTNTYSGETTINDGVLEFGSLSNLGNSTLIRNAGGTLRWGTDNTADISGATVELLGASVYLTPNAGNILSAGAVFDIGANDVTLANAIGNNGVGGLTKTGSGTLTLGAAPTYKGATLVTQGALNFPTIAPNTTRALYLLSNTGTVSSTVGNGLHVDSLIVGGAYSGTTAGTGTLTVNGGAVTIGDGSGDDLLLLGVRTSTAGTAPSGTNLTGRADFQNASSVAIDVSEITLGVFNSGVSGNASHSKGELLLPTSASAVNSITANAITLGNAPAGVFNLAGVSTIDLGGGATTMNVNTLVIGGRKSAATMTIDAGGSFTLRGVAGGETTANVFLGENDNAGSSTNTDSSGTLDLTGATADMKINSLNVGRLSYTSNGSNGSGRGILTFDLGTIEASTIRMADANFNPGGATGNDAETSGTINQGGGTLRFAEMSKGTGTAAFNWNGGTIGNIAGADLTNQNVTVSINGASAHTFNVDAGRTATFQSEAGFAGDGGFTKSGVGTLELNGANTHTGDTAVEGGTLLVGGSITASAVSVKAGVLGGVGSITNAVSIGDGTATGDAILSPGTGGIGTLSTGALTLGSDAVFALEINIANATTVTGDLLTSSGPLTLSLSSSPELTLANLGSDTALTMGTVIPFLSYSGGWNGGFFAVGGNVINDYNGAPLDTFTLGVNTFAIDYDAGGNTAALVVVPEPGTASLALAAAGVLLGFRRSRRGRSE